MVQIAEPVPAPKTLEATLSYFVDTEAMPVTLVGAPGGSDQRVGGGTTEQRRVVLHNGRPEANISRWSATGFALSITTPRSSISSTRTRCAASITRRCKHW